MEKHIQNIEYINQYINKSLSKTESQDFENRLKTDESFNTIYNEHVVFLEGLNRVQLKQEINTARQAHFKMKWIKISITTLSAIVVSVLVYSVFFSSNNQDEQSQIEIENKAAFVSDSILETHKLEDKIIDTNAVVINNDTTEIIEVASVKSDSVEVIEQESNIAIITEKPQIEVSKVDFNAFIKTSQTIIINTEKDTTIICKEGTKFTIKAKSFVDVKTNKLARGKINFEVTEYYKLSDMLLANLTTTSNGEQLETGGMLHIEAKKGQNNLKLKKPITITFPSQKEKPNMQLFTGIETDDMVNWIPETDATHAILVEEIEALEEAITVDFQILEEVPIYPGCENGTQEEKRKCFQEKLKSITEKNFDTSIAGNLNLIGRHKITTYFKINREGEIVDIEVFAPHVKLGQEAIRVLELIPKMQPAKYRGKEVNTHFGIPIYFNIGKSTRSNPSLIKVKAKTTFEKSIEARLNGQDSTLILRNSVNITANEISQYAFASSNLGWINCDRFVRGYKQKVKYKFKIKNAESVNVKMVFKSISSILPSKAISQGVDFGLVPKDEEVILVAIKKVDDKLFLGIKETITRSVSELDFEFKEVTLDELKLQLQNLNSQFD